MNLVSCGQRDIIAKNVVLIFVMNVPIKITIGFANDVFALLKVFIDDIMYVIWVFILILHIVQSVLVNENSAKGEIPICEWSSETCSIWILR